MPLSLDQAMNHLQEIGNEVDALHTAGNMTDDQQQRFYNLCREVLLDNSVNDTVEPETPTQTVPRQPDRRMPRTMNAIKQECYEALSVADTPALKRVLTSQGHGRWLRSLNLRTKAGWQSIWNFLHRANAAATDVPDAPVDMTPATVPNDLEWRPCGIEIEFAPARRQAPRAMQAAMRRVLQELHANGHISEGWESQLDCSCGNEVVSPILYSREQFTHEVGIVREAIRSQGGRHTARAGGHVHIDCTGYTGDDYLAISTRYAEVYESTLQPQLMRGRHNNRYAIVTRRHTLAPDATRTITQAASYTQARDRYRAVNGLTGSKTTIEYRQGNCIINRSIAEVTTWVDHLQALHQHRL